MIDFFLSGGIFMWPMLAVAVGILYLGARTARYARRGEAAEDEFQRGLHGILFWGVMSVLLGALGTVTGIVIMTQAAAHAGGAVEPALIWGGINVALPSIVFGMALFIGAAMLWFMLRFFQHRAGRRLDA